MFRSVEDGLLPWHVVWRRSFAGAVLLAIPAFASFAAEIKLQCQLKIEKAHTSGRTFETDIEKRSEDATVEISELGPSLVIGIDSTRPIISVATGPHSFIKRYENKSTANVWELNNEVQLDGTRMTINVKIDRNTGLLNYSYSSILSSTGGIIEEAGSGYCSKVDTTKKKF